MVSFRLKFCNVGRITRVALTQVALESALMQTYDIKSPGYSSEYAASQIHANCLIQRVAFILVERELFSHWDTSVRVSFRPAAGIVQ
jgi:hypothetical protein